MQTYYIKESQSNSYKVYSTNNVKKHGKYVALVDRGVLLKEENYWSIELPTDWDLSFEIVDAEPCFIIDSIFFTVVMRTKKAKNTIERLKNYCKYRSKDIEPSTDWYFIKNKHGKLILYKPRRVERFDGIIAFIDEEIVVKEGNYWKVNLPGKFQLKIREHLGSISLIAYNAETGIEITVKLYNVINNVHEADHLQYALGLLKALCNSVS